MLPHIHPVRIRDSGGLHGPVQEGTWLEATGRRSRGGRAEDVKIEEIIPETEQGEKYSPDNTKGKSRECLWLLGAF